MVAGGELDEPQFIRNIEAQGGQVVADDVCFAIRSFWDLVPENGDPWENILRRYLFHVPCARMVGSLDNRTAFLTQLVKDFRADGIIFQRMKNLRFQDGRNQFRYSPNILLRGVTELHLAFDRA